MRAAILLFLLVCVQIGWGVRATGQAPPIPERTLNLIPTALQELHELRVNTGNKAVLRDGSLGPVYVKKMPTEGHIYLNFHVDLASEAGPVLLRSSEIHLDGVEARAAASAGVDSTEGKRSPEAPAIVSYVPMDWFIDTGLAEVRGDSLTVEKAILQFTIEVPRAGLDELVLFVRAQRIGTVSEIRKRITGERRSE